MLPVLEVSRLSSASSFYSAITQSLGLGYLANHAGHTHPNETPSSSTALVKSNPVLVFGDEYTDSPVFQLRLVDNRPLQLARIVLSANSLDAVNEFHAAALRAFPRSAAVIGTKESLNPAPEKHNHIIPSVEDYFSSSHSQANSQTNSHSSTIVARVSDFDGNTMAVEYQPYHQSSHYGGGRSSHHYNSSRVLDYSTSASATAPSMFSPRYSSSGATALTTGSSRHRGTVATADMSPAYYDHYSSSRNDRMGTLRRSATSASAASYESDPSTSSSSNKGGMGSFGLAAAGAVGAMAGAAITYTVMRSRSQSRSGATRELPYEYDCNYNDRGYGDDVPSFQRRETAPAAIAYGPEYAASRYSARDNGGMRTSRTRSISSQKDVRQIEDVYDYKDAASVAPPPSYHTTYARSAKAPSTYARSSRSRSEAPVDRAPLMLTSGSEKGPFDGYDYGNGYDGYEKSGYDKYDKADHYEKADRYEKSDRYDKYDRYDKRSYVSERTERSRVPPNSSRSAPLRASTYAPSSQGYSQHSQHQPSSRRSRSSSRSRGHAYGEYEIPNDSQATLVRSSSSRAPPTERAESHATLRSGSRGYSSQSHHRSDRSDHRGRASSHSHSHAPRYEDDRYDGGYDDDDGDADSVTPDDSISCVGGRGRYR